MLRRTLPGGCGVADVRAAIRRSRASRRARGPTRTGRASRRGRTRACRRRGGSAAARPRRPAAGTAARAASPEIHHPRSPSTDTGSIVVPGPSAFTRNASSAVPGTAIRTSERSLSSSVGWPGSARHARETIVRSAAPATHAVDGRGSAAGRRTRGRSPASASSIGTGRAEVEGRPRGRKGLHEHDVEPGQPVAEGRRDAGDGDDRDQREGQPADQRASPEAAAAAPAGCPRSGPGRVRAGRASPPRSATGRRRAGPASAATSAASAAARSRASMGRRSAVTTTPPWNPSWARAVRGAGAGPGGAATSRSPRGSRAPRPSPTPRDPAGTGR